MVNGFFLYFIGGGQRYVLLQDDPLLKGIKGTTDGLLCQEQIALCKSMHIGTGNAPIQDIVQHRDCFFAYHYH